MNVRRRLSIAGAILLTVAISAPLGALASHQFTDVPDSNPFHADIDALVDAGVTSGCGSGKYCPSANVTREQMAAFLNRLGALSPTKTPVVNADKLDGYNSSEFIVAGDITHIYGPASWLRNGSGTNGTITHYTNSVQLVASTGTIAVQANPQSLFWQHDRIYLLDSVEICYGATASGYIDTVIISGRAVADGTEEWGITDGTNRTTAECRTYDVTPTIAEVVVSVYLTASYGSSAVVDIRSLTLNWTQLLLFPLGEPASPTPGGTTDEGTSGAG